MKTTSWTLILAVAGVAAFGFADEKHASTERVPGPDAQAAKVPKGYQVKVIMKNLDYPTSVEFDGMGAMYVAEAGYSYGDPNVKPRIIVASPSGEKKDEITEGLHGPVNDLLWHQGRLYVSHKGRISVLEDGGLRDLVTGLPSDGDHQNNQMTAGPDGKLYVGQGVATNSGVVGLDNVKMGWVKKHPKFHDIPARDIRVSGRGFESNGPHGEAGEGQAQTAAFQPFGEAPDTDAPVLISGETKAGDRGAGGVFHEEP